LAQNKERRKKGEASESCTDSDDSSDEQDGSPDGRDVGNDFTVDNGLLKDGRNVRLG